MYLINQTHAAWVCPRIQGKNNCLRSHFMGIYGLQMVYVGVCVCVQSWNFNWLVVVNLAPLIKQSSLILYHKISSRESSLRTQLNQKSGLTFENSSHFWEDTLISLKLSHVSSNHGPLAIDSHLTNAQDATIGKQHQPQQRQYDNNHSFAHPNACVGPPTSTLSWAFAFAWALAN